MSPACALPSTTYSMVRSSFWKRLNASSAVFGTKASPLTVPINCWRSASRRRSAMKRASVKPLLRMRRLEARAVELAVQSPERRVLGDLPRHLGVAQAEPQRLAGALVDHGLGDHLIEQLPVEAQRLRLVGQDRPAQLAAELLQPVLIELAERLDPDFGAADLRERRLAEAAEDVADAPDREADGDQAQDHAHDGAADPIRGGSLNTSEHETVRFVWMSGRFKADWGGI